MNTRLNITASRFWILGLALLLPAAPIQAAPIRVTTWDLQPGAVAGTNGGSGAFQQSLVREAADALKNLRPDVIILQHVAGWGTCRQLAQALQPETYQVAACSSFPGPRNDLSNRQVAILSRGKAYLSWSEPWQNSAESPAAPGGFAFAAMRLGGKNIGIFSVQFGDGAASGAEDSRGVAAQEAREESARQLVRQIASLQNWKDNRPQALIVAGDFNTTRDDPSLVNEKTLPFLEQIGFADAFAGLPLEKRVTLPGNALRSAATLDYIFTRDAGLVAPSLMTSMSLAEHYAATCEMDLAAPASVSPAARAELPLVKAAGHAENLPSAGKPQMLLWSAGFLAVCLALFFLAQKLARRSGLQPAPAALPDMKAKTGGSMAISHGDQIVIAPPSESPPYVQIEIKGSTQTQSQTWYPRPDAGGVTAPMPEAVRAGVIANLSRWLKQKALRRLVSDRAQLLATQEAAALKVLAVDQRLTKVEHQIQQRNQEYEQRIDDLLKALITAQEENRELIRAKIALVKAEMEKARLRDEARSKEHEQY